MIPYAGGPGICLGLARYGQWNWRCNACHISGGYGAEGYTSRSSAEKGAQRHQLAARHLSQLQNQRPRLGGGGDVPPSPEGIWEGSEGCHTSDIPRSLLPEDVKPWEMRPSDARVIGLVLRCGTEDSRARRLWRLNSP